MAGVGVQLLKLGAFAALCGEIASLWTNAPYPQIVGLAVFFLTLGAFANDGMPRGFGRR